MSSFRYANISMEILCCTICLILLFCIITTEDRKEKLNRIFISVLYCHIPLLLVDTVIFILEGNAEPYANFIFRAAYFLSFILGTVLLILFTRYLLTFLGRKTTVSRRNGYISYGVCVINIILVILTQFNGLYYFIGEGNTFYHGDWYWLSQLLAFSCIFLITGIIIAHRKDFKMRERIFLLSYAVLPTMALVIQNMIKDVISSIDIATTLTIVVFFIGIQNEQTKRLKEKEIELTNTRISVMLSQIQPHFLYNSLTAISGLCGTDPERAEEALNDFSHYLRKNLDSLGNTYLITFENELEHLEHYLKLEKMRFGDRINVVYDLEVKEFVIPPLTVQPLAENAIRYGITKKPAGGTLTIATRETKDSIIIAVSDDGLGFADNAAPDNTRRHVGIENVKIRIEAQVDGTLAIDSKVGVGTVCTITIPKMELPEMQDEIMEN